jgi:hypothetical protein
MENVAGALDDIGSAREALRDPRLSKGEKNAVRMAVASVGWLTKRFGTAGVDDAGHGVQLILRSSLADSGGPFAEYGSISVSTVNPINEKATNRATRQKILPRDVALHELTHVVQFAQLGSQWEKLHPAIGEGLADSLSMLATRDWGIGEGYWPSAKSSDRGGTNKARGHTDVIRDVGGRMSKSRKGDPVVFDYRKVARGGIEEHAAGGVVSRTVYEVQQRLGWKRAEDLVWHVIRDRAAWNGGGSWKQLSQALTRGAAELWPNDATAALAVADALRVTHLDEAAGVPVRKHKVS